jgi:hypothetical protein
MPVVTGYGQNLPQLRRDQIKNERKAERDMAHGNYQAPNSINVAQKRPRKCDKPTRTSELNTRSGVNQVESFDGVTADSQLR